MTAATILAWRWLNFGLLLRAVRQSTEAAEVLPASIVTARLHGATTQTTVSFTHAVART
jgi:ABC-type branched-subunit amino acid transport system permease subunit